MDYSEEENVLKQRLAAEFNTAQSAIDNIEALIQAYIKASVDVAVEVGKESGSIIGFGIEIKAEPIEGRFERLLAILEDAVAEAADINVTLEANAER